MKQSIKEKPLVSIVVATRNRANFLHDFLESIEAQTYPHWEAVIVDDASTDETPHEAHRFEEHNPGKVRYIQLSQNIGFTAAAEKGIQQAAGALIMYMGDDDLIMPQMLEKGATEFKRNPELGLVYANLWQDAEAGPGRKQHFSSHYTRISR